MLRHVGEFLIEGDELPPFRRGQVSIGSVRIEAEGHHPGLPRHAARFIRPHEPYGNVGFATAERHLLPLGGQRKPDVRILGLEARKALDEKMRNKNGRRAERHPTDKRRMGGLRQARDAVSPSFHFLGSLQHLPADCGEAAGSRQAIDKPNVKRGLKRGKPPADRGVVHFQIARSTGERTALRHGQEMPDVFPIDHLCGISRITRIYTEFPHRRLERIFEAGRCEGEQNAMPGQRFGVGIVGVEPGRSWAARGHIPALRALSETFEIIGVANTSKASAEAAAVATGLPRAFADVAELVAAPEVDIVTVAVKVPPHLEIVKAAIGAGKHVYCEWPLGNGLAEAEEMAALAQAKGVLGVVGTQARVAPEIEYLRYLIADGFVGDVLSTTLVARGGALQGGGSIPDKKTWAYLLDRSNGATLLTIPVGHTLAALRDVFGEVAEVSAVLAVRRPMALAVDTGEMLPVSAPDQVLVSGAFATGVALSIHYRGGASPNCSTAVSPASPARARSARTMSRSVNPMKPNT